MENLDEKQPYEEYTISNNFALNFSTAEIIASQSVTAVDKDDTNVTDTITDQTTIANDGIGRVYILIRGGAESKSPYKITFRCITSAGHKWEKDFRLPVRDI